jgi:diaminopimelate epimerase
VQKGMSLMKFTKMQGNGNDFIVIEDFYNHINNEEELAIQLCDRHFGIGGDGILIVRSSNKADIQMVIINSDGSYAAMCGNGIRCFAKYVYDNKLVKGVKVNIETGDGIKIAYLNISNGIVDSVKIYMGVPNFSPSAIPANTQLEIVNSIISANNKEYEITSMLMGVPHTIIFGNLEEYDVYEGRTIEKHELFKKGTNVNFCQVVDRKNLKVKTWERGAGPTLACGTGSCAAVVAANRLGFVDYEVNVEIPGGKLLIEIYEEGVYMTGPAVVSFKGEF